jgi:hypothetical protein
MPMYLVRLKILEKEYTLPFIFTLHIYTIWNMSYNLFAIANFLDKGSTEDENDWKHWIVIESWMSTDSNSFSLG